MKLRLFKFTSWTACFFVAAVASESARAEPYLAVYEGMQCSSCHSQQAGGGMRNAFGNAYAQTGLPAQRIGGGGKLWTGALTDWLSVGGDLRADYRKVNIPNNADTSDFDISKGAVYVEARLIPDRLSVYVDQQFAPDGSLNREAYLKLLLHDGRFQLLAGQFFLTHGLRLQDDTAFIRQTTGVNFLNPDRGIQLAYQNAEWSAQLSLTDGTDEANNSNSVKQISLVTSYVRREWRVGASININNNDAGDRHMQNIFAGLRTGPVAWLAELDFISDEIIGGPDLDGIAGLLEANWRFRKGHNLKVSYDYFDPDNSISENHQVRYNLIWEYTPIQFLQGRFGVRLYDGIPQIDFHNRDEFFAELHGFF